MGFIHWTKRSNLKVDIIRSVRVKAARPGYQTFRLQGFSISPASDRHPPCLCLLPAPASRCTQQAETHGQGLEPRGDSQREPTHKAIDRSPLPRPCPPPPGAPSRPRRMAKA